VNLASEKSSDFRFQPGTGCATEEMTASVEEITAMSEELYRIAKMLYL
jgi:hypothetical protein